MQVSLVVLFLQITLGSAFVQQSIAPRSRCTILNSHSREDDSEDTPFTSWCNNIESMKQEAKKTLATAFFAATLWASPSVLLGLPQQQYDSTTPNIPYASTVVASAKEMASGSGSRVNKDPESLLRYGLPINNKEVRHFS